MRYNKSNSIHNVKGGMKLLGTLLALLLASSGAVAQSIGGSVYGGGKGKSAVVTGPVKVEMEKGTVTNDVYGGGALANVVGGTTVNLKGGTVSGDLYGGGLGDNNNPVTVSNAVQVTVTGGSATNVFGCNNINGAPQSSVQVDIKGGNVNESVFGGGNLATYGTAGNDYPVVNIEGGTVKNAFGGGMGSTDPTKGVVTGNPQVTVKGGAVSQGTYGGGQLAKTVGNPQVEITSGSSAKLFGGGMEASVEGSPTVTVTNGSVTTGVYGGCDNKGNITQAIQVNANGGNIKDVYGGGYGYQTTTGDNVNVTIDGSTISGDVYGGSALGQVNDANSETKVWLKSDSIAGNIYGGGEGQDGDSYVTYGQVNGIVEVLVQGGSVNNVYGCNNKNGAPQQTVKVDVEDGTVNTNVYGGGNLATYSAGSPEVNIKGGTVKQSVFGGGNQAGVGIANGITKVNLTGGSVGSDGNGLYGIYGGCNEKGTVTGDIQVNITNNVGASAKKLKGIFGGGYGSLTATAGKVDVTIGSSTATPTVYGDVYGGSALGSVNGTASNTTNYTHVTLKKGAIYGDLYGGGLGQIAPSPIEAKVYGPVLVKVEDGTVDGNVYGCNNLNGSPQSTLAVEIEGGTVNTNVFGGGNLANASCAPHVTISNGAVKGDVYGGGAFANTGATIVDILGGTIGTSGNNTLGNVFGGGLGGVQNSTTYTPTVGAVTVNIGAATETNTTTGAMTSPSGDATILGSVYGCNNEKGSPTGNVTVNIYQTRHTTANQTSGTDYAIKQVFGGGKKADYSASEKKATVNIWGCENTIERVFGGGDAAAAPHVETNLYGGRFDYIFGGGNGEDQAANITGNVNLNVHGGSIGHLFGGSNTSGSIGGQTNVLVDNTGACDEYIAEFFGGGNMVPINGNVNTTIGCGTHFGDVYGGSNKANITGHVKLNVIGGTFKNIFGGSKGVIADPANNIAAVEANIDGNVTLNLFGGIVAKKNNEGGNVFGGSNYNGNITGKITVNVLDTTDCQAFTAVNLYGAGNLTAYTPTSSAIESPEVNIIHIKDTTSISGNVYGGGLGASATVSANPKVTIGYDAATMGTLVTNLIGSSFSSDTLYAKIDGNVYGGGDLAAVAGGTTVTVQHAHTQIGNDVYGGGNEANVKGSVTMNVKGGTIGNSNNAGTGNVYGGGALADVNVTNNAHTTGAITTVNLTGGTVMGSVYGGGLGRKAATGVSAVEAKVYGPVQVNVNAAGGSYNNVFGCNNVNGAPQDTVSVEIYACDTIGRVFGGGNMAEYLKKKPSVNVRGCSAKIGEVYGGGNEAAVLGTNVVVYGCDTIGMVYGGGRMANINHDGTRVYIKGGSIGQVYGGNNISGEIKDPGDIKVFVEKEGNTCEMHIGEVYGGGNHADSKSYDDQITIGCTGGVGEGINYVYGGANEANVSGNITLNIKDGRIANVFGGNNTSGTISGNITVNIDKKTNECGWNIGNVYGGGNKAAYGTAGNNYPQVNVLAGTVSGDVFGGGLGSTAVVTGNPRVTVDGATASVSGGLYGGGSEAAVTGNPEVTLTNGALTDVYGGGKAANVNGAPTVYINGGSVSHGVFGGCNASGTISDAINVYVNGGAVGTSGTAAYGVFGGGFGSGTNTGNDVTVTIGNKDGMTPTIYGPVYGGSAKGHVNDAATETTKLWLKKGSITGDIYGGGFGDGGENAKVFGKVQVLVDGGSVTGSVYGCNNQNGSPQSSVNVDINNTTASGSGYAIGKVFGGGNEAAYDGTPVVKIHNCNNKIEYVYGGGNNASVAGTDVTVFGGNNIAHVFGGCYGADIAGGTDVKIYGGTIDTIYGGNNESGSIAGNIQVTINKQPEHTADSCEMHIKEVYGGGNKAASNAGQIAIGYTGYSSSERINYVYGGANRANVTGPINLTIREGRIDNVFGGNNNSGEISDNITVNIQKDKDTPARVWEIGNVFGGGNLANFENQANVNILKGTISHSVYGGGNRADVGSSVVTLTDGLITEGLYGGCNAEGTVTGDITLNVNGGQVGVDANNKADIYGGGYGKDTESKGDVTVNFGEIDYTDTHTDKPKIFGDIYGGSALGQVNETGKTTTVNVLNGVVNGNVYGGGLGQKTGVNGASSDIEAKVLGKVFVNVGKETANDTIGGAYLHNSVIYGCNNINGSPQDDATVNIWRNGLCDSIDYNSQLGDLYSIDQVFGGGNRADFNINGKFARVFVHDCSNSIRRVFGGSDASAAYGVKTVINGGRFDCIYGGGNGELVAANIGNGGIELTVTAGIVSQLYGGSNQNGTNTGGLELHVSALNSGDACKDSITEFFCGGNYADVTGNVITTIDCSEGLTVNNLYGGCNHAKVLDWPPTDPRHGTGGNIILTVKGGNFENVFGGSKGDNGLSKRGRRQRTSYSADIDGSITLNLYGGTIQNVYGGSNILGNVGGTITVNVIDHGGTCPLIVNNIYGGGNETDYRPTYTPETGTERITPMVNIFHGTINGNVYGGAKGSTQFGATTQSSPKVIIGYDSSISTLIPTSSEVPTANFRATVKGDVYGGGDAAAIDGNTEIQLRDHSKVRGNIYGGGNQAEVTGNTKVIVDGKN